MTRYYATPGCCRHRFARAGSPTTGRCTARLELVRALQDHGFTPRPSGPSPAGSSSRTSRWGDAHAGAQGHEELTTAGSRNAPDVRLRERDVVAVLEKVGTIELLGGYVVPLPNWPSASSACSTHRGQPGCRHAHPPLRGPRRPHRDPARGILAPYLAASRTRRGRRAPRSTVSQLRQLTLEAVVTGRKRATPLSRLLAR